MHPQCTERSYLLTSNSVSDKKIPPLGEKKDIFRQIKIVFHQGTLIKRQFKYIHGEEKRLPDGSSETKEEKVVKKVWCSCYNKFPQIRWLKLKLLSNG